MTVAVAGLAPANAADLVEPSTEGGWTDGFTSGGSGIHGVRAVPVALYDYEPGVLVRSYWGSPWRHRHYFPTDGKIPALGRLENLSAIGPAPRRAETFHRAWSTTALFVHDAPIARNIPRKRVHARTLDDEGVPLRDKQTPLK
jgi:hypothetical protein